VKTIGLLGGMSWESTVPYYQIINRTVAERLGWTVVSIEDDWRTVFAN